MIRIVPRTGMIVIDPASGHALPAEGVEIVRLDSYWIRRQSDGDITVADLAEGTETTETDEGA